MPRVVNAGGKGGDEVLPFGRSPARRAPNAPGARRRRSVGDLMTALRSIVPSRVGNALSAATKAERERDDAGGGQAAHPVCGRGSGRRGQARMISSPGAASAREDHFDKANPSSSELSQAAGTLLKPCRAHSRNVSCFMYGDAGPGPGAPVLARSLWGRRAVRCRARRRPSRCRNSRSSPDGVIYGRCGRRYSPYRTRQGETSGTNVPEHSRNRRSHRRDRRETEPEKRLHVGCGGGSILTPRIFYNLQHQPVRAEDTLPTHRCAVADEDVFAYESRAAHDCGRARLPQGESRFRVKIPRSARLPCYLKSMGCRTKE